MDCSRARNWLFKRIDNELPALERELLETHLADCPSCARELKLLMLPRQIGRLIPALEPSPYFYQRLRARLESEDQGVTIWQITLALSRQVVPALALITLCLLTVFAYLEFRQPAVDVYQAYDMIFMPGDRPQRMVIAEQGEITDESVLLAISEEEPTPPPDPQTVRKK